MSSVEMENNSLPGCCSSDSTPRTSHQADSHSHLNGKANGKPATHLLAGEIVCARRHCKNAFHPKREAQRFCTPQCRNLAFKKPKKTRLRSTPPGSVANGTFFPTKSVACKHPQRVDLGTFVRSQILDQQDQPNPIGFMAPDRTPGRVWLATDPIGAKVVGDDRHWRINIPAASKVDAEARAARLAGATNATKIKQAPPKGIKARLYIGGEEKLQVLGCGWRNIICQFRGANVVLHHNGNKATVKQPVFKNLVASTRSCLERNRKAAS